VRGLALARTQEDGSGVSGSDEPEERVDEIDPDSTLHANDAGLLGRMLGVDVDFAEDAKEGKPKDAENPVPGKCPVRLEERNTVYEYGYGRESSNDFGVHPFAVSVGTGLVGSVEVYAVQTGDGDCKDELEEPQDEPDQRAYHAAAAGAVANKVESAHGRRSVKCDLFR